LARFVVQSSRSRRIVAQISEGEELLDAILSVCKEAQVRCARVSASGALELLELADPEQPERALALHGAAQLLHAGGLVAEREGKLDIQLSVVAARKHEGRLELVGGLCTEATAANCELVIEALDDVILRRGLDPDSGALVISEAFALALPPEAAEPPAPAVAAASAAKPAATRSRRQQASEPLVLREPLPPKPPPGKPSWADAVMASVRASSEEPEVVHNPDAPRDDDSFRPIRVGDILDHNKFGRCVVQRIDQDQEYATVRLRNDRLVRLNLEVLRLRYTGDEDGHQIFNAVPDLA
jgi:predicted DNA-binding protein with PD1-like motif